MILNTHRKRYLFTKENIVMVDLLANDEMAQRVAIPQIRGDGDHEREQGREEKQGLPQQEAHHEQKQDQPIPGTPSSEQILIIVVGKKVCIHFHTLPAPGWRCNLLNRYGRVLYKSGDNLHTLLPAHTRT